MFPSRLKKLDIFVHFLVKFWSLFGWCFQICVVMFVHEFQKISKNSNFVHFFRPCKNAKQNSGMRAELSICLYNYATSHVIVHEKLAQQYKNSYTEVMGQHIKQSPTTQ
jgi:hypothetical protein